MITSSPFGSVNVSYASFGICCESPAQDTAKAAAASAAAGREMNRI
jgi:hypothetical protein